MTPLHYAPGIETIGRGEQASIDGGNGDLPGRSRSGPMVRTCPAGSFPTGIGAVGA